MYSNPQMHSSTAKLIFSALTITYKFINDKLLFTLDIPGNLQVIQRRLLSVLATLVKISKTI